MAVQDPQNENDEIKIPWHFWIFAILVGSYLGYRFFQMIYAGITAML